MDLLYRYGAEFIWFLQKIDVPSELFVFASHFADPPVVNLIAFPLAFFFHPILGSATLLSINFSEWVNGILKWILDGDRPYWWVQTHESLHINLRQFPLTCETGPGNPSGHCMVMAAGWLPLLLYLKSRHKRFSTIILSLFVFCTILVAASRLYIATHFPHQVFSGSITGILLGFLFYQWALSFEMRNFKSAKTSTELHSFILDSPLSLLIVGILSFIIGLALGGLLKCLGIDIGRSYRLSTKYCARSEWVHSSTSVTASYARVAGALIGLAGAFHFRPLTPHTFKPVVTSFSRIVLSSITTFFMYYVLHQVVLLVSPTAKSFAKSFSFVSNLSFLLYMAVKGSLPPLIVALIFPALHDRFFTTLSAGFHSQKPELKNETSAMNVNGIDGDLNTVRLRRSRSRRQ